MTVGKEIDLLQSYPKANRDPTSRADVKTEEDRMIAREFGRKFFDGDRRHGYGGFSYNPRFWSPVCPDFINHFGIKGGAKILDVGCAKGFMLVDFLKADPTLVVRGIDVSEQAVAEGHEDVREYLDVGDASNLTGIATGLTGSIGVSSEGTFVGGGATIVDFKSSNGLNNVEISSGIATVTVQTGASIGLVIALGG